MKIENRRTENGAFVIWHMRREIEGRVIEWRHAYHKRPDPQARELTARYLREARRRLAERISA